MRKSVRSCLPLATYHLPHATQLQFDAILVVVVCVQFTTRNGASSSRVIGPLYNLITI